MPYIKQSARQIIDSSILNIIDKIKQISPDISKRPGVCNYAVTRIIANVLKPENGWSYHSISIALAVLHDAETEMRRRLMDTRENIVKLDNGDIPEYVQQ